MIIANHVWEERLHERSVRADKCTTILNFPTERFRRQGKTRNDGKFVILYPGTLNHHQGVDIAVRAFYIIKDRVPEAELHIYGDGDQVRYLDSLIVRFGLQDRVFVRPTVPLQQIPNGQGCRRGIRIHQTQHARLSPADVSRHAHALAKRPRPANDAKMP